MKVNLGASSPVEDSEEPWYSISSRKSLRRRGVRLADVSSKFQKLAAKYPSNLGSPTFGVVSKDTKWLLACSHGT